MGRIESYAHKSIKFSAVRRATLGFAACAGLMVAWTATAKLVFDPYDRAARMARSVEISLIAPPPPQRVIPAMAWRSRPY